MVTLKQKNSCLRLRCLLGLVFIICFIHQPITIAQNQPEPTVEDYYKIITVPIPEDLVLEVSGMDLSPNGDLVVTTRFGEVWLIENPYMDQGSAAPNYKRIASGLHTPMGLTSKDGKYYTAQRTELTELSDLTGDGKIDSYQTFCTWDASGNYCEYTHGPILLPDGSFWINMNLADGGMRPRLPFFGEMIHLADWKGWAVLITPEGELKPYAAGLRSPAGMGIGRNGEMYYTENEGGWIGTGFLAVVEKGDFYGSPPSLKSAHLPGSTVDLRPSDIPDQEGLMFNEAADMIPELTMPAVRLPHGVMGVSTSWVLEDTTGGAFGPFEGQLFVSDQGHAKIMRVFLEEVNGRYQGAAFQFREGFQSGIIRSSWGKDGSMFAGMSDRGWRSLGQDPYGLQRLKWTGKVPFEIKEIRAKPDGFTLEFTKQVDSSTLNKIDSYNVHSFDYLFRKEYGSPVVDRKDSQIRAIIPSNDGLSVRIVLDEMRKGYIYQIATPGIESIEGNNVLHPTAFYSLNNIPDGETVDISFYLQEDNDYSQEADDENQAVFVDTDEKHVTEVPESWEGRSDQSVTIGTAPGLQFDRTQFQVRANSRVRIVFNNTDDMPHNLVITMPDKADEVGELALGLGIEAMEMEHVPDSDLVLYYTSVLGPGESQEIFFTAPSEPGEYDFVCTYPGHYMIMRGKMTVTQ